jgi:hypothetical protein
VRSPGEVENGRAVSRSAERENTIDGETGRDEEGMLKNPLGSRRSVKHEPSSLENREHLRKMASWLIFLLLPQSHQESYA